MELRALARFSSAEGHFKPGARLVVKLERARELIEMGVCALANTDAGLAAAEFARQQALGISTKPWEASEKKRYGAASTGRSIVTQSLTARGRVNVLR